MKELDWLRHDFITHRGFHREEDNVFENTIESVKEAIKHNYAIEIDVRLTKDNKVIVFHDRTLKRVSKTAHLIRHSTFDAIKDVTLGNTSQTIPLLTDVIKTIQGQVGLLIEIKPTRRYRVLCKQIIHHLASYKGKVAIQSYDPRIVRYFKRNAPSIIRGLILEHYGHAHQPSYFIWRVANSRIWMRLSSPDFLNYNIKDLPNKKMDRYKQHGLPILSFVARSQKELDDVRARYDNAVFEHFTPKAK